MRRPPTRQEGQAQRPIDAVELEQPSEQDPALCPAGRVGEEPVGAPALLVELDERFEVGQRVG